MDNKKIYIVLLVVGAAAAISGILLRRWGGPSTQTTANIVGWGGIAILLIARIVFGRRSQPPSSKNRP